VAYFRRKKSKNKNKEEKKLIVDEGVNVVIDVEAGVDGWRRRRPEMAGGGHHCTGGRRG
jgi:hypothetical protein